MKTLKDLKLKSKDKKRVKEWLTEWINMYVDKADGRKGTIERVDFENLEHFFYTDCTDILGEEPESLGKENNKKIINRKKFVNAQLLLRHLLGEKMGRPRACSHCGNSTRWINAFDNTGHYVFCDKCKMTTIVFYPEGYETFIPRMVEDLKEHGYVIQEETTSEKVEKENEWICDTCSFTGKRTKFSLTNQCNSCYMADKIADDEEIEITLSEEKKKKEIKPLAYTTCHRCGRQAPQCECTYEAYAADYMYYSNKPMPREEWEAGRAKEKHAQKKQYKKYLKNGGKLTQEEWLKENWCW